MRLKTQFYRFNRTTGKKILIFSNLKTEKLIFLFQSYDWKKKILIFSNRKTENSILSFQSYDWEKNLNFFQS